MDQDVPSDTETLDATVAMDAVRIKIQKQNRKAYGLLVAAIDCTTDEGKLVFKDLKAHKNDMTYKFGNFKMAWAELEDKFNSKEVPVISEKRDKYCSMKMEWDDNPRQFIQTMDVQQRKLNCLGVTINNDEFKMDILSELPKAKLEGAPL